MLSFVIAKATLEQGQSVGTQRVDEGKMYARFAC